MVKSVCLPVCFLIYYNLSYREKYKMERKELDAVVGGEEDNVLEQGMLPKLKKRVR